MRTVMIDCGSGFRYEIPVYLIAEIYYGSGGWGSGSERRVTLTTGKVYSDVENLEEVRRALEAHPEPELRT